MLIFLLGVKSEDSLVERNKEFADGIEIIRNSGDWTAIDDDVDDLIDTIPQIIQDSRPPRGSCYSKSLREINANCDPSNIEEREILTQEYVQCFISVSGWDFQDESLYFYLKNMVSDAINNLCAFSQQVVFNEDISNQLNSSFASVIKAQDSVVSMIDSYVKTNALLNKTSDDVINGIQNNTKLVSEVEQQMNVFIDYLNYIQQFGISFFNFCRGFQFYSIVIGVLLFIGLIWPINLIPSVATALVIFFADYSLNKTIENWNELIYRYLMYAILGIISAIYPIKTIIQGYKGAKTSIKQAMRRSKQVPKLGYVTVQRAGRFTPPRSTR